MTSKRDAQQTPTFARPAPLLWSLTFLFFLRVVGQAVQCVAPQPWLPAFHSFQGGTLRYAVLLLAQIFILGAMIVTTRRLQLGKTAPRLRTGAVLAWMGGAYFAVCVVRVAVGLFVAEAPGWFTAWIPAAFHFVLAVFVLTLSHFHRRGAAPV